MHATYVATVNRPHPEGGVPLGGPSLVVDPHGQVVAEGTEDELWCDFKVSQVVSARAGYPGYLESPLQVYADSWGKLSGG
jgi:predicted amidohydrolase